MSKLCDLCGKLKLGLLTALCWTALAGLVLAQEEKKEDAGAPQPYLLPYVLVLLSVGLGMMIICRPSYREDRTKKEALPGSITAEQLHGKQKKAMPSQGPRRTKQVSPEAKSALTLAIVGAVLPVLGLLLGPFAFYKASQARQAIKRNPRLTGDNFAVAGMIVGGVAVLTGLVWLIILGSLLF